MATTTPSQDAFASIVTQVSPTGQPARAPARPVRPRQGQNPGAKRAPGQAKPKAAATTSPATATKLSAPAPVEVSIPESQHQTEESGATTVAGTDETKQTAPSTADSSLKPTPPLNASANDSTVPSNVPSSSTTNAGATSRSPAAAPKKKRKSFFASLFGSCMSSSSHDDERCSPVMAERRTDRPVTQAGGAGTSATKQPAKKDVALVNLAKDGASSSKAGTASSTTSGAAMYPKSGDAGSSNLPQSSSALVDAGGGAGHPPSPKSEISPEVLAASSPQGASIPLDETEGVLSGAVQAPGSEGLTPKKEKRRRSAGETSSTAMMPVEGDEPHQNHGDISASSSAAMLADEEVLDEDSEEEYLDEDERLIAQGGIGIPIDENGNPRPLLQELTPSDSGRKCLVLDLDETLVHSSFKLIHSPDFIVPVEIENQVHNVYVIKRPGVDAFMKRMGEIYEVVVFTASLSKYADPVLDCLDIHHVVKHRLFRESCYNHKGNYVKDLSQLGRPIGETIIIDNSPASYIFHPNNAVPVSSWFNDPHDTELTDLQHFLADLAQVPDVRGVLDGGLFTA